MSDRHTEALLLARQRYLAALELQQAQFGLLTPAYIVNDIAQTRAEIEQIRRQRTQQVLQAHTLTTTPPGPARGLILLVSPRRPIEAIEELSSYQTIMYHQRHLEHCWLIATSGESGSLTTAQELVQHFGPYGVSSSIWQVLDPAHVEETFALVDWIYTHELAAAGLDQRDVIADITGATKPMTAGMVLACGRRRPMQYMIFQQHGPSLPLLLRLTDPDALADDAE